MNYVLGIDGGGSKTVAWIAAEQGDAADCLGRGLVGPSNPYTVGFSEAAEAILEAASAAMAHAGLIDAHVTTTCLCLAGVGRDADRQQMIRELAGRLPTERIRFVHDGWATLAAASYDVTGLALICGTGSFAFGRTSTGNTQRVGGWGYLMGDEGSGYSLVHAALRAIAQAADGRAPATHLADEFCRHFDVTAPSELIPHIYGAETDRRALSALCPLVFSAYERDDSVARELVRQAAHDLASHVFALAEHLAMPIAERLLAVSGGVVSHQPHFVELINQTLAEIPYAIKEVRVIEEPVIGAVRLAKMNELVC